MSLLLAWSLRAGAVVALGLLLNFALRRRSAATRSLVVRVTLVAAWLVPLAVLFAPRIEVPLPAPKIAPTVPTVQRTFHEPTPITEGWSVVQPDPRDITTLGFQRVTPFSTQIVPTPFPFLLVWFGGSGLLVLRWLAGMLRLRRLRCAAAPTDEPDVWRASVAVPATYGRTILMPLASQEWPEARVEAAILHERAHVRRHDWHWQTLVALFAALHWPNPFAWILSRALRDAAETAADDEALALMRPSDYARELLAVAASVGPAGPALAMARRGGVKARVASILAERDRQRPTYRLGGLLLATILDVGIVVAGLTANTPRLTVEEPAGTLDAEGSVSRLPDGTQVELVSVESLTPDRIDSWDPSGAAIGPPAFDRATALDSRFPGRRFEFRFRVSPSHSPAFGYAVRLPEAFTNVAASYGDAERRVDETVRAYANSETDARTTPLLLGVAEGPLAAVRRTADASTVEVIGRLDEPHRERIAFDLSTFREEETRFVALTSRRRWVVPHEFDGPTSDGKRPGGPVLRLAAGERVRELWLRHRPYRWIAFHNVPLIPRPSGRGFGGRPLFRSYALHSDKGKTDGIIHEVIGIQNGENLRLMDVREVAPHPSLRWDASGATVPTPHDVAQRSFVPGMADRDSGQRLLEVRFSISPPATLDDLMIRPIDPGVAAPFGVSDRSGRTTVEATVYAPQDRTVASFRVGRGVGTWKRVPISPEGFAVRPSTRFEGTGRRVLEVAWPMSLGDVATHFEIRDAKGTLIPYGSTTSRKSGGRTLQGFYLEGGTTPKQVDLWSRPYEWSILRDVPLVRPNS